MRWSGRAYSLTRLPVLPCIAAVPVFTGHMCSLSMGTAAVSCMC